MVDLIRGAISEVEAYERVDVTAVQPAGVLGRAVGDVIHLLAELVENATAFSPPDTRVTVSGTQVANGYALEITDQGLGMSDAALETANTRLASSPEFDPAQSARLGLFVVARLAARHGVRVGLRPSGAGGVTAVVLIPGDLVTTEPPAGPDPATLGAASADPSRRLARTARRGAVTRPRTRPPTAPSASTAPPAPPTGAPTLATPPVDGREEGAATSDEPGDELDGLPRRVRRRTPAAQPRSTVTDTPSPRSPEEVRQVMAALQAGTARGRATAITPTAPPAATGPAVPTDPPTIPEPPTVTERDA